MNLDKAIAILVNYQAFMFSLHDNDLSHALKLGIEALKRIKKARGDASRYYIGYLPGETEK